MALFAVLALLLMPFKHLAWWIIALVFVLVLVLRVRNRRNRFTYRF